MPYYYASAVIPANYFAAIDSRSLEPNDSPSSSSSIHVPLDRYEPRPTFRTPVSDAEWPIAVKVRLAQLCPPCDYAAPRLAVPQRLTSLHASPSHWLTRTLLPSIRCTT